MCFNGEGCVNCAKYDWPEKMKRQFATYPSAASESLRMASTSPGAANSAV